MFQRERAECRIVLCAAAVAAFSLGAMPTPARADDDPDPAGVPAQEAEAPPELEATAAELVEEAFGDAGEAVATADDDTGSDPATEPVDAPEEAAPTTSAGAETASAGASDADTAPDSADIAADSTAPATSGKGVPEAAEPPPSGMSTSGPGAALNVNVSVRIGSAGDNGAVTQSNTAAVPAPVVTASANGAAGRPAGAATPAPVTTAPAAAGPTWYWEWDCASAPFSGVVSPTDSSRGSFPSSWTWIWNCGDNSDQYRAATSGQYQQANANISIRISSPGNDGDVSQTNVVIPAGPSPAPSPSEQRPSPPALPTISFPQLVAAASIAATLPSLVVAPGSDGLPAPVATPPAERVPEAAWLVGTDGLAIAIDLGLTLTVGAPTDDGSDAVASLPGGLELGRRLLPPPPPQPEQGPSAPGRGPSAPVPMRTRAVAQADVPAVAPTSRAEPDAGGRAKPGRRWAPRRSAPERRAPAPAPAGPSASAAGAGGSSGGGLPIYLALPFLAAMLDLARRVALERATWPSGHPRRTPDTPG